MCGLSMLRLLTRPTHQSCVAGSTRAVAGRHATQALAAGMVAPASGRSAVARAAVAHAEAMRAVAVRAKAVRKNCAGCVLAGSARNQHFYTNVTVTAAVVTTGFVYVVCIVGRGCCIQ